MSVSELRLLWQERRRKNFRFEGATGFRRVAFGPLKKDRKLLPMENQRQVPGDSPWQSIRLAFGALLLILGGLGLMLMDGNNHTSTARSSAALARSR